jgi:hypothetical protein
MKTLSITILALLMSTSTNRVKKDIPLSKHRPTIEQIVEVKENELNRLNSEIKQKIAEIKFEQ